MKITKEWIFAPLTKLQAEHTGAVWNQKEKMYRLPKTIGVLKELEHFRYPVQEDKKRQMQLRINLIDLKGIEDVEGDTRLRPYQRVDVNYLNKIGSAGIFNAMRTGKTPTTLILAEAKGFNSIVVVAPASLLINWKEEIEKWTNFQTIILNGTKKQRQIHLKNYIQQQQKKILVVSYETLRNDLSELKGKLKGFDCMIVDEAHRLRSLIKGKRASKESKAVVALGKLAGTRYALTGTPTVKEGQEIWGILHFLYPSRFPGYWQFVDRYFNKRSNGFGIEIAGYKRKGELQDILAVISTNRKRKNVMVWLPEKQYQTIKLEMNTKQAKVYKDVLETFEYEDKIDAPGVLAQLIRLKQVATCPGMLLDNVINEKEKFILEWISDHPTEPVIIFSTFSSYLKVLQKKIKGSRLIIGDVSKNDRDKVVKDFQAGRSNVILANIKAAGTGLTLDKAETVIFLDKEYNPSDNEQAEDRIVPVAKERNHNMHVISLVMIHTVDEMINDLLLQKIDITKVINSGGIVALERMWKK